MDPESRQKTIEMGHKLKDIMQAIIDLYPTNRSAPLPELKKMVLSRIGPVPLQEMELPVAALVTLYEKVFARECSRKHYEALQAMSEIFAFGMEEKYRQQKNEDQKTHEERIGNARTQRPPAVAAAGPSTTGGSTAPAGVAPKAEPKGTAAPAGHVPKNMVSREQYEKMLER